MSCYCREKVLRIPVDKINFRRLEENGIDKSAVGLYYMVDDIYSDIWDYATPGKFSWAPTEYYKFVDYVLDYDSDADDGSWGKTRSLKETEKEKYRSIFMQIDPDINMNDVRLVEFCWYNSTEAPDYYNEITFHDSFYDEV